MAWQRAFAAERSTSKVPPASGDAAGETIRRLLGHNARNLPTAVGVVSHGAAQPNRNVSAASHASL